jgi:hypothetical protein
MQETYGATSGRLTDATNCGIAQGELAARRGRFTKNTPPRSRGAMRPSLDSVHPRKRGRRECRVRTAPAVSCAMESGCAHEHTGSAEASGIPCVMALRLMPCSPRRRIRLVTVIGGYERLLNPVGSELATADLAPATGVRTTWFCRTLKRRSSCAPAIAHEVQPALRPQLRADALASTTSRPAFVTTRDRPSSRNGMAAVKSLIWGCGEARDCPSG